MSTGDGAPAGDGRASALPPLAESGDAIRRNLSHVRARLTAAAARAGRDPEGIRLLPVSKTVPSDRIRLAASAGCSSFGENRVQEAARKHDELIDLDISWSVIGHLQTNKVRDAVRIADEIQSVDSVRLAETIDRRLDGSSRVIPVWAQVNSSGEQSKFGVPPEEVKGLLARIRTLEHLHLRGLMTLAVFSDDRDRVRRCFTLTRGLRDRVREENPELIGDGQLSMGMSGDLEIAIEEGATCVRVGQAIFGRRNVPDSAWWPEPVQSGLNATRSEPGR